MHQPPMGPPPQSQTRNDVDIPNGSSEATYDSNSVRDAGLVRRRPPEQVVVGEIRQNLDDLKAAVLSYYSRLYSQMGRSIDERLDRLAAPPFSNTMNSGRLPFKMNTHSYPKRQPGAPVPPPNTHFNFLADEQRGEF